jgi:long-chain fatty acid transport protein
VANNLWKVRLLTAVATTASLLSAAPAYASAFYLPEQSIKGAGRAYSGEAADSGPESLWWNPAAIGGIGRAQGAIGVTPIFATLRVRDRNSRIARPGQAPAPVGGDPSPGDPAKFGAVPSGAIAVPLSNRVAIGLAVTSPFSFTNDYQADSFTRYAADRTRLITIDLQPSIAVQAADWLRVGAGLNIEYSDAYLSVALPNLSAALPDGRQALSGDGWDTGWSAGVQVIAAGVTAGFSYKSSIEHNLEGRVAISGLVGPLEGANARVPTTAKFRTPWQAIGAVRVQASPQLTVNAQVTRFGWSGFDRIRLTAPAGAFIAEDYRDTWLVAGGADYAATPNWTVRAGLYFDQTPTRNGRRNPSVPDANRLSLNAGASYRLNDRVTLDAAAEYIRFERSTLDRQRAAFEGTPVETGILTDGVLSSGNALTLGVGARFVL